MRFTDSEWFVMNAVWEGHPASARDVLERIGDATGWAYTTVRTMLERLVEKGALEVTKHANTGHYTPLVSRLQARRSALRSLLDKAFDGTFGGLLHHLVADERLSAKDRQQLAELLADAERTARSKRR